MLSRRSTIVLVVGSVLMAGWFVVRPAFFREFRRLSPTKGRPAAQLDPATSTTTAKETSTRLITTTSEFSGWSRFRGPNGTGLSRDTDIPIEWSDSLNLQWKCKLPGAGSSSPILTDKFVFVTTYSGYGETRGQGSIDQLERRVVCVDRAEGNIVWQKRFPSAEREDPYQGMGVPEHGYATNTGATDGESVFMFLGKSGVVALNLNGDEKWRVSVGTESGNRQWGSAASLILYDDLVIVNASEESQTLYALQKTTGTVVWKAPAASLELCYGTPAICKVGEEREDLVVAVAGEVWGLNPRTGKLLWYATSPMTGNLSPSVIVDGEIVYAFGGYQSSGSIAVRAGGDGDVTKTHVVWTSRTTSYVPTPVLVEGKFHWIDDRGMYYCSDAATGKQLQRSRGPDFDGGRPVYASPIAIDNKLYIQSRWGGLVVLEATEEMKLIAHNRFESDATTFNATPAVDQGRLFLRSDEYLYCVGKTTSRR